MDDVDLFEMVTLLKVPTAFRLRCRRQRHLCGKAFRIGVAGSSEISEMFTFEGGMRSTMLEAWRRFADRLPPGVFPIGIDSGGNLLALNAASGAVLWSDHEEGECINLGDTFETFENSLTDAEKGKLDIVESMAESASMTDALLFLQANQSAISKWGRSLAQEASRYGNLDVLKACAQAQLEFSGCIHLAAMNGHIHAIRFLREVASVDLHERDVNGWTPLQCARRHPEIVSYLREQGCF